MIKISHECPVSIFEKVQKVTEYDYFLVHLLESSKEYREMFLQSKDKKREIILDNSIFELGQAFDSDKFAEMVTEFEPTWYIIPDALEDCSTTITKGEEWFNKYGNVPGKRIGVVQGGNYEEIVECYRFWDSREDLDMIAISFDYSYYEKSSPHPNKYMSWALGRVKLLGDLVKDGVLNTKRKHHLLGSSLPLEFILLRLANYNWIYSLDTSNPIVHAIKSTKYIENFGLTNKESQKLHTLIKYPSTEIDMNILYHNLVEFRKYVNG